MKARFDSLGPRAGERSFLFEDLVEVVEARRVEEVRPVLAAVEARVRAGGHAAGFVAYEAAPAFDRALVVHPEAGEQPLAAFGIFGRRREIEALAELPDRLEPPLSPLTPEISRTHYLAAVGRILELIAAGDTYQVNYTFRLRGRFEGDPELLYRRLAGAQRSAHCALLEFGDHVLLSASPELFYRRVGMDIEMRPMKGTRRRGRWVAEDDALAAELAGSPKDRAENLMIVDLLRNDLGRICRFATVEVPRLFEVERYPTVHQLTSTIRGVLREGVGLVGEFEALFPSGSVTGAPKIRTSEIIAELEESARGIYTGAIGFATGAEATFSVAIRTPALTRSTGEIVVGIGSGITADSDPDAEYRECITKGAFLSTAAPDFQLLESLRLEVPEGYPLLERHLNRMRDSARYFGFPFPVDDIRGRLEAMIRGAGAGPYKVRLLLDREGGVVVEREAIALSLRPARVRVASRPVDDADPFLYHKTTYRRTYQEALAAAGDGVDDVILFNAAGEVTEATVANVVLELDGKMVTPPVESGLLPGLMRQALLDEGRIAIRVVTLADLDRAERLHLINAVRGWRAAVRVDAAAGPSTARA